uniref:EGF-like domain-containing protein n=1 Tax=Poecilia latipinna TaxID=48699 RepID=A0A3B3VA60_9TELE
NPFDSVCRCKALLGSEIGISIRLFTELYVYRDSFVLHGPSMCVFPPFLTSGYKCEFLPCEANNPCENGAVCVEELDQDRFPLGFRCHCRQGFSGPRCEINVDECSSSPCFHGFCYDGKKQCFCSPGWTGVDCAQDVNECDSGPCLNGARCTQSDIPGEFSCTCSPFFTGLLFVFNGDLLVLLWTLSVN